MKTLRLSRRAMLRGSAGVAVALPWLEAMSVGSAGAQSQTAARRFIGVYQPGGTILSEWLPTGSESNYALSPILAPLEQVKDQLLVLSGLDMLSAIGEQSQSGLIALLTGTPQSQSTNLAQGPSLDQVLAPLASQGQRFPSLQMAVRWGTGKSHGLPHAINILAYADDSEFSPIAPQIDPQGIWESLFGAVASSELDPSVERQRSVLDYLDRRYESTSQRFGTDDRQRLEHHLDAVRALEVSLNGLVAASGRCRAPELVDTSNYDPDAGLLSSDDGSVQDLETDAAIPAVGAWMMDMLVMAMACDLTSVGTLQWSDTEAKHTFPWLGLEEHHAFYQNDGGFRPLEIAQICTWYSEQHAYLLQKMADVDMGGRSLLDESVVLFGTEVQDPATHLKNDMPFLLGGSGGGLRSGRWLSFDGESHNDLLVSILNLFGEGRESFGFQEYCAGPLSGLV